MINTTIKKALQASCHHPELLEVMDYAVFPAGKLFRPRLVEALAQDLKIPTPGDYLHLASAIELHHAYTLVHDDLPAMDNDLIRRGKASTHAQYGEWKAILAGDALLITSFEELMNISSPRIREIHKLMSWATGAKGLIDGQFRDLAADGNVSLQDVVRIHELKTARLIQLATLGTYLLCAHTNLRGKVDFLRLGREIGVSFQLLDDLSDLMENEISEHEKAINPFISHRENALLELIKSHRRLRAITKKHKLQKVDEMLMDYFKKNQTKLLKDFSIITKNVGSDFSELKDWLTSFV